MTTLPNEFNLTLSSEFAILPEEFLRLQDEKNYILGDFKFNLKNPIYFDQESSWEVGLRSLDCPLIPVNSTGDGRLRFSCYLTDRRVITLRLPFACILNSADLIQHLKAVIKKTYVEKLIHFDQVKNDKDRIVITLDGMEEGKKLQVNMSFALKSMCGFSKHTPGFENSTSEKVTFTAPRYIDPFTGTRYLYTHMLDVKSKVPINLYTNNDRKTPSDNLLDSFCLFDGQVSNNMSLERVDYFRYAPTEINYCPLTKSTYHNFQLSLVNEESRTVFFYGCENFIQFVLSFRRVNNFLM